MADLWYPRGVANHAPRSRWLGLTGGPPRGVLHTTETFSFSPGGSYYGHNGWPHATLTGSGTIFNHIPVNYGAPTLVNRVGGVNTNTQGAVQIEICWRAAQIQQLPLHMKDALRDWMRWVEAARGVKRTSISFVGPESSPARVNAAQRMSGAAWNAFDGWAGHQHVPENEHWDPGHIDIAYLIGGGTVPVGPEPPKEEEDMAVEFVYKVKGQDLTFTCDLQTQKAHVSPRDRDLAIFHLASRKVATPSPLPELAIEDARLWPVVNPSPALTALGFASA